MIENLFKEIKKNMRTFFRNNSKNNIPFSIVHYIVALFEKPDQSLKDLTEELCVDKAHTTRAISFMEKKGIVLRIEDQKDKRMQRLRLTAKGIVEAREAQMLINKCKQSLIVGFSSEELRVLDEMINKIYQNSINIKNIKI